MTVFLIRHGESTGNRDSVFSGVLDHPLTETGRRQAQEAAARLGGRSFAAVFTSALSRAVETADIILAAGRCRYRRRAAHAELNERDFGVLEGVLQRSPQELAPDDACRLTCLDVDFRPDQGESIRDTFRRVTAFFHRTIRPAAAEGDLLVVAHGNVIKCLIADHLGWPVELIPDMPMRNCLITELWREPGGARREDAAAERPT